MCAVTAIFGTDLDSGRFVYEHLVQTQVGAESVQCNQKSIGFLHLCMACTTSAVVTGITAVLWENYLDEAFYDDDANGTPSPSPSDSTPIFPFFPALFSLTRIPIASFTLALTRIRTHRHPRPAETLYLYIVAVISLGISWVGLSSIDAASIAVYVCLIDDPDVLKETKSDLYDELVHSDAARIFRKPLDAVQAEPAGVEIADAEPADEEVER